MPNISNKVGVSFYIESKLAKKLDREATRLRISRSDVLRSIIRLYYSKEVNRDDVSVLPAAEGVADAP